MKVIGFQFSKPEPTNKHRWSWMVITMYQNL